MIIHHAQAVVMSDWAPSRADQSNFLTICKRIALSQRDEITLMQHWLQDRHLAAPDPLHMLKGARAGPVHDSSPMGMPGMDMGDAQKPAASMAGMDMGPSAKASDMAGMDMSGTKPGGGAASERAPAVNADHVDPKTLAGRVNVDNVAMETQNRQGEPGAGLAGEDRRTLVYADLKAITPDQSAQPVDRDINFHLTGNMQRWTWGFDGKTFSQAGPVNVRLGERVRFVLINDTMMEHPIHLHGFLFSLENGNTGQLPLKHTVNVKPGERVSFVFTADTPGHWAFHCHLLYHMETGMFRTVLVA